ncbi:MAG: heavy metal translocating P-type ATPase metal-binding domain-containing protein [Chitinophagales bacterium]
MNSETVNKTICFHCGEDCKNSDIHVQEKYFCCTGCKMVYEILNQNDLCTYYDLNENPGVTQKIKFREDKFAFLDDVSLQQKLIQFTDGNQTNVTFYLPQIHCSSCLWLLENLHKINMGVISSKVNFPKKEVFIVFSNNETSLRKIVETLTSIGYEPHISLQEADTAKISTTAKPRLMKLGIAGFCFANIMMMSLPEYFSLNGFMEENIHAFLKYFIVLLSLPVFFYCATEFYVLAWKGLKNKYLNIDFPIAIAIVITFARSLYEIFSTTGSGYLDSMSGIVFFMLLGRILQDKTYQSISFDRDYKSFFPISVNVIKENKIVPTAVDTIKQGDVIQIYSNELIPLDGILSKGKAEIDYSFVSGESLPVTKDIGEIIYAGGKQTGGAIELMVTKEISQSYLTNLWNKDVFKHKQEKPNSFIHVLANNFTMLILIIAFSAACYWYMHDENRLMWNTLTTVLIVACPCALLLSSTFTNGNILSILSNNKFYLRHPDVIENISNINHIVFDKTGTLTNNQELKVTYHGNVLNEDQKINIASLLAQSSHPLSKAITEYLNIVDLIDVQYFKTITGSGMEAWIEEKHYKIGSKEFVDEAAFENEKATTVFVKINNDIIGYFQLINSYRFGFMQLMRKLSNKFSLSVISGDNDAEKKYLQKILPSYSEILFNQKPHEKLAYVEHLQAAQHRNVMMVGDGLNDAGALKQSNVGIAVTENSNNFTPACDAILDASQFSNLDKFIRLAKAGKTIILISFILSVFYNIIGLYFAVQGTLSPLIAAILMPCSSISIILITYGLSKIIAWKIGLLKHDKNHK